MYRQNFKKVEMNLNVILKSFNYRESEKGRVIHKWSQETHVEAYVMTR